MGEKEVEENQPGSDEFKRVLTPVSEVFFVDNSIQRA